MKKILKIVGLIILCSLVINFLYSFVKNKFNSAAKLEGSENDLPLQNAGEAVQTPGIVPQNFEPDIVPPSSIPNILDGTGGVKSPPIVPPIKAGNLDLGEARYNIG
ncbi:MAG: hypothetical protein JST62_01095 [Bacteroidetes bacterium]|nr:hypothetical protein [Bacteroidota bacterium]